MRLSPGVNLMHTKTLFFYQLTFAKNIKLEIFTFPLQSPNVLLKL